MNPLIRLIPPFLVRFFARPYVAGDSLAKAMDVAASLWHQRRLHTTLDLLAEDIHRQEQAQRNLETYLQMVDAVAAEARLPGPARPTLSLKPSSYTTQPLQHGGNADGTLAAIQRIVERARERSVRVTVDMESHHWADFTLQTLQQLHAAGHRDVGGVLQTRLNRTEADLDKLPAGMRVRLVIGIYREPASIAVTDKKVMKQRMLDYGERLLRRGHYVEFATHDDACIRSFVDEVVPRTGVGKDRFEVQMLYGVPRERLLRDLCDRGVCCRLYVPFALSWAMAIQYLRRRLDEFPAMMFLVSKNLILRR